MFTNYLTFAIIKRTTSKTLIVVAELVSVSSEHQIIFWLHQTNQLREYMHNSKLTKFDKSSCIDYKLTIKCINKKWDFLLNVFSLQKCCIKLQYCFLIVCQMVMI